MGNETNDIRDLKRAANTFCVLEHFRINPACNPSL